MSNILYAKPFNAGAAVAAHRIMIFGADEDNAVQATAVTEQLIGVSTFVAAASGERCDVNMIGVADVEFGGNVTIGAYLTTDSDGKAVVAAPDAGDNAYVIGIAMVAGAAGDIGSVLLAPSRIQG